MFDTGFEAEGAPAAGKTGARVAIVTGYFREDRAQLERCLGSVRAQTVSADHIVVADGHPQAWLDQAGVRHIRLDRAHGDYGGTPRGVGALLAIAEDYDAISFLDADNWLEPDHVEEALRAARNAPAPCDYVVAQRHMRRPDATILDVADEPLDQHVDTSCFIFLRGAFHALPVFALIPRELSAVGDRLFYANLRGQKLKHAVIGKKTVNYHCIWASVYEAAGEVPPPGAKPSIDNTPLHAWLAALSPLQRGYLTRRTGLTFGNAAPAAAPSLQSVAPAKNADIQSFDVFDTLIARRCLEPWRIFEEVAAISGRPDFLERRRAAENVVGQANYTLDHIYDRLAEDWSLTRVERDGLQQLEIARELANVVPIAENLAQVRDGDILVSDMYLDAATIRRLLETAGLKRQVALHVEAHGKSRGLIWPRLAAQGPIKRHLGDNPHSDVAMPQRFAIEGRLTSAATFSVVEDMFAKAGLRELALLCREARLATCHDDPKMRALQLAQVGVNLPMLLLASVILARLAHSSGKRTIAFCSRDCNLWLPLFEAMVQRMGLAFDCRYFLTSRVARKKGSQAYLDYAADHLRPDALVVDLCGTGWSLAHLAQRLGQQRLDVFLLDYLPPFAIYERAGQTPDTCTVHRMFENRSHGNNVILELANQADHGMLLDMRRVGATFLPVFEDPKLAPREAEGVAVQRAAFLAALERVASYRLTDVLALDDASLQVLCGALYQYISRQTGTFEVLARGFLGENDAVMRDLVA